MEINVLLSVIVSFCLAWVAIPQIVKIANIKNLFDEPNNRKLHKKVVPALGGVAIFLGTTVSSSLFLLKESAPDLRYLFISLILMFFMGLKDDMHAIAARKKLLVQTAAALILVLIGNFRINHLYGIMFIDQVVPWLSISLSVLVILFIINAVNLTDGVDGLAGGITLFASAVLGAWFYFAGTLNYAIPCFAMCGSLLAFLYFNVWGKKNKVFMGDTGSLVLGVFLAAMVIKFNELNYIGTAKLQIAQAPLIIIALLIVPTTDTLRVFMIRIWHKRSPFSPDMNHFHHLLIKAGLSHIQVSCFMVVYSLFFLLLALTVQKHVSISLGFFGLLALSFSIVGMIFFSTKSIEAKKTVAAGRKIAGEDIWEKVPDKSHVVYSKEKTIYVN